jgi:hypothetical protein
LESHRGQLLRAAVELAKDWRTDKYLRNLEAMMIVADKETMLILTGNGDVLEPEAELRRSGRAAIMRWLRRGRSPTMSRILNCSRAGRWRSPPRSACSPTTS